MLIKHSVYDEQCLHSTHGSRYKDIKPTKTNIKKFIFIEMTEGIFNILNNIVSGKSKGK